MKKKMSWIIGAMALVTAMPAMAATNWGTRAGSSVDLTGAPATRERANVNYEKYETRTTTRTYNAADGRNIYYSQPVKRSDLYRQYDAQNSSMNVRTTRAETVRSTERRKYFLAHPFFQPLKGKFGSVTDLSYAWNSYDIEFNPIEFIYDGNGFTMPAFGGAKWDMTQLSVKEDFSFGITDRIALIGMLRYDSSDYKFDWSDPTSPTDKMDDSGINLYGIGGQWRFLDNAQGIGTLSAYYQKQKDVSNNFLLELKAGYKVQSSTIYGLARGWYVDFEGTSYGNGIEGVTADGRPGGVFLAYETDADKTFYIEGGVGVFSVLDEDWTLNAEAVFGNYDWHNQMSIKGAIGWQPNDWFALNIYAKTALYDSADGKDVSAWFYGLTVDADNDMVPETYVDSWVHAAQAKIDNYSETTIGVQAIFMF